MGVAAFVISVFAFLAATVSAFFAWQQVRVAQSASRAQSLLAILEYLQREDIRASRREVLTVLAPIPFPEWTEKQQAAASNAAAAYDLVGVILRGGVLDGGLIIQTYGASIIRCYEICAPMVENIRGSMGEVLARSYWEGLEWLVHEARKDLGYAALSSNHEVITTPE